MGAGSGTLNHGGDLSSLQQLPSQSRPSQSGSLDHTLIGIAVSEFGFPDSQYQLFPTKGGGKAPGLIEQGQLCMLSYGTSPSLTAAANVQRCCRGEPYVILNPSTYFDQQSHHYLL